MIELAPGLLGLAAICADRSWRIARRAAVVDGLEGWERPRTWRVPRGVPHALAAAAGWWLAGIWGAAIAPVAVMTAVATRSRLRAHRAAAERSRQLVDAVGSLAAAVRSGRSVHQAITTAAGEVDEPLAGSLHELEDRLAAGVPFEDAVRWWAARVDDDDAVLVAGTLSIHRQMGGDLPAVLDRVADTLREREAIAAEVRSMTAQARLSGAIVGALPAAFLGVLVLVSREDVLLGLSSPVGKAAVAVGLALEAGAFLWIRRLLEIR